MVPRMSETFEKKQSSHWESVSPVTKPRGHLAQKLAAKLSKLAANRHLLAGVSSFVPFEDWGGATFAWVFDKGALTW